MLLKNALSCVRIIFKKAPGYFWSSIISKGIGFVKVYFLAILSKELINTITESLIHQQVLGEPLLKILIISAAVEVLSQLIPQLLSLWSAKNLLAFRTNMSANYYSIIYEKHISIFDFPAELNAVRQLLHDQDSVIHIFDHTCMFVMSIISMVVALVIAIQLNPIMALLIILFTFPTFFVKRRIKKNKYETEKELNLLNRKTNYFGSLFTNKATFREMKMFDAKQFFLEKFTYFSYELNDRKESLIRKHTVYDLLMALFFCFVNIAMNFLVIFDIVMTGLTVGDFSYYTTILTNIKTTFSGCLEEASTLIVENEKYNNYSSFSTVHCVGEAGNIELPEKPFSIEFKNVSFKYPNTSTFVLKNVSFLIKPNERIALAGLNGAGKTTIISLLLRFYEPTEGTILIDNIPVQEYKLVSYRKRFSSMFQEATPYSLPLKDNLFLDNKISAPNDLTELFKNLSLPFDETSLDKEIGKQFDDTGEILSYGQIQKLCFARTLLKEAEVYILDEPSASLDPYSEHTIFQTILDTLSDKTLILISHRLSNLKNMDRILFFEKGILTEIGAHAELINNKGKYAQLYALQSAGYL